jgi:glycosyltransferase involved in cell wall biosynthesis/CelD/BcsL family acetyltransferase involved in cellulose biosynthesis
VSAGDRGRRRPRVVVLTDAYWDPHGGTEGQVHALVSRLPPAFDVELWTLQRAPWLEENPFPCRTRSFGARRLSGPAGWWVLLRIARELCARRVAVLHAFMTDAGTVAPLLGRIARVPVVVSRRDLGYWRTPRRTQVLRRTARLAALYVANAQAVKEETVAAEHVVPSRVRVVRNGHDPAAFDVPADPGLRPRLGIPEDARLLGLVANVRPLKRHEDLVEALARLAPRHPDVRVLFVGEGDFDAVLERARERGVRERVHADVAKGGSVAPWLRHLAAGVLCSESEGLSNAVLEYMACGLPVVASRVGGNPELVEDGANGFLYEAGDVAGLAAALDRVLSDPALARSLGAESRRRFERSFTVDRMVADTRDAYRSCLRRDAAPSSDLEVEVVGTREGAEALADAWRALAAPRGFFAGPDWVLAWLEHDATAAPEVLVARRDGAVVGLLPLVRRGRTLAFAGTGFGADHLDVVAAPGEERAVAAAVLARLARSPWRRLDLRHVAEDAALRAALHDGRGVAFDERFATLAPYVRLEGTWASYLESLTKNRRRTLRNALPRALEEHGATVRVVESAADAPAAIDDLVRLHRMRFDRPREHGVSTFGDAGVAALHRRLAERLAGRGALSLVLLEKDGTAVAAQYGFRHAGRHLHFNAGFDPAVASWSPGTALTSFALQDAFARGLEEYDFLDGTETYKGALATAVRRLFDLDVRRADLAGRAGVLLRGGVRLVRDLLAPERPGERMAAP